MHRGRRSLRPTVLLAIGLGVAAPSARALELISANQLIERCRVALDDASGPEGQFCSAYLRGFIDGSPLVAIQPARTTDPFTQRALRTRLGRPASAQPKYCIAGETTMRDLVEQLLAHAREAPPRSDSEASALIQSMLERYHPCIQ